VSDPYLYPASDVLRNKLGLTDSTRLEAMERLLVTQRIAEGVPAGIFDLSHLRAIHKHIFQDLYDWAGEIRRVEIAKDGDQFQFCRFIETGMANVHARLAQMDYLKGLNRSDFAREAGRIVGDVNYIHPFREGNGRVQLQYLNLLAANAGHPVNLSRINPQLWLDASRVAFRADYAPMAAEIERIIE
jgi:cell filamentation protein